MLHPRARAGKPSPNVPTAPAHAAGTGFKGNKASLPHKPCVACGRPMSWRRAWARNWAEVKYCSEACRSARGARAAPGRGAPHG